SSGRTSRGVVRPLASHEPPTPIAIGVQCDYLVGDVADRDGDRQDVHRDALRVQDHRETLRDVEVDVELGDPLPLRARLRDQTPKLGWRLIGLPVTYLDTHATRTGRQDLRDRDADRSDGAGTRGGTGRLQDGTARWRLGGARIVGVVRIGADHAERDAARDVPGYGYLR